LARRLTEGPLPAEGACESLVVLLFEHHEHVLVFKHMGDSASLRAVLGTRAPHKAASEVIDEPSVDPADHFLDGGAVPNDHGLLPVRNAPAFLGVHPDKIQVLPDFGQEDIKVQVDGAAGDHRVGEAGKAVALFEGDEVALVVAVEGPKVHPVAENHVDQFVGAVVSTEKHFGVADLVFFADQPGSPRIHFRQAHGRVKRNPASGFFLECDVRLFAVQADATREELLFELVPDAMP